MNNQKDNSKSTLNSYGQTTASSYSDLNNKPVYEFASKKTEKLVTALYMITDCMDSGDAIKGKLRSLGVDLLTDIHKLSIISPIEKHASITGAKVIVSEVLSLIHIAHMIGYVSEMNASILKKEFSLLTDELSSYQSAAESATFSGPLFENKKAGSVSLDEKMFDTGSSEKITALSAFYPKNNEEVIKDKRTEYNMSFKNRQITSPFATLKRLPAHHATAADKIERSDKILALIKDSKGGKPGEQGVSIKDISGAFKDCSEKTIQRELNALVEGGKLQKLGAKRWSRYLIKA